MEESISLKEIFKTLKKRKGLIGGVILIALIISAVYTFFIATPQYQASTQILVNQTQESEQPITANELQSNLEIINTYNVIITSPIILDIVLEETGLDMTINELQSQISVSAEGESQVVILMVENADPQIASDLANTISEIFEQEIPRIMNIDNVSILSSAQSSDNMDPVSPQPVLNLVIAAAFGLLIGIVIAFLLEFLDQSIKTEADVEKILQLPILGSISVMDKEFNNHNTNSSSNTEKDLKNRSNNEKSKRKTS